MTSLAYGTSCSLYPYCHYDTVESTPYVAQAALTVHQSMSVQTMPSSTVAWLPDLAVIPSHTTRHEASLFSYRTDQVCRLPVVTENEVPLPQLSKHEPLETYQPPIDAIEPVPPPERGRHACRMCQKTYCRKSTLRSHMRQHLNSKPFTCKQCLKGFSQSANLAAHRRTHTGEKPFVCHICNRSFSQSSTLVTHRRIHSGERPYQCQYCAKSFTDSSTLTKHIRTHTGLKPYQCERCALRFSQSGNLNRHRRTHRADRHAQEGSSYADAWQF